MFELLAAVLDGNQIQLYTIATLDTFDQCIVAAVGMAKQMELHNQLATFVCAKGI